MSTNDLPYETDSPQPTRSRKTPRFLIGVTIVSIFGIVLAFLLAAGLLYLSDSRRGTPEPHIPGPEREARLNAIGYHGEATNTGELSSKWASGLATAWTLLPEDGSLLPAQLIAEGSTLYTLTYGSGAEAVATVSAYDVSGAEPVTQWSTTGPKPSRIRAEAFPASVVTQDEILLSDMIVDRSTGQQSQAPWGFDLPMGVAGDVLVTCDTFSSCSGWSHDSGEWTTIWTTQTSPQHREGLAHSGITKPATAVIGSGADTAVVVPIDDTHHAPQIINPATGALTTLGDVPSVSGRASPRITLANDGILVAGEQETVGYDTAGNIVGTFGSAWELEKLPTSDRELPSVVDLGAFLTHGVASWTTATVERVYSKNAHGYTLTVSSGGDTHTVNPGASFPYMFSTDTWSAAQMRASSDGRALYIQGLASAPTRTFFFNTEDPVTFVSPNLEDLTTFVWVYDDLLIGARGGAIVAFTPDSK